MLTQLNNNSFIMCLCRKDKVGSKRKTKERCFVAYGCFYGHVLQKNSGGRCFCLEDDHGNRGCYEKAKFRFYLTATEYCRQFGHDINETRVPNTWKNLGPSQEYVRWTSEGSPHGGFVDKGTQTSEEIIVTCSRCSKKERYKKESNHERTNYRLITA